jgi:peptidoglycan/xylan/chitin deacetylase (PgdA/CDA1 family)
VQVVAGAASQFMSLLAGGAYDTQWGLLSPVAQRQWPSQQDRTHMLSTKFAGFTLNYTLGMPTSGATWASRESLTQVPDLWEVPCSVTLSGGPVQLPGTTAAFSSLPLYLSLTGTTAQVVGEGAASLDAPILRPAKVPDATFKVPALMYHEVAPAPAPANYSTPYDYNLMYQLTVPPDEFSGQMDWLAQHGYHPISLARLADALYDGLPLPANPIVITFDDGFLGQYTNAVSILKSHGFTATFFVCTGLVGWQTKGQHYARWDQLREMAADGFWIEDHTVNDDTTYYGQTTETLDRLLLSTQQVLVEKIGRPVQFFAYSAVWPYPAADQSGPLVDNILPVLEQGGYQLALTDPTDLSSQVRSTQPYQVPRIRVSPDESIDQFANELAQS